MTRRLLLTLAIAAWLCAAVLAVMAAVMLINRVPDATGGAVTLGVVAVILALGGAGLKFVAGSG